jgi:hypothetical protein
MKWDNRSAANVPNQRDTLARARPSSRGCPSVPSRDTLGGTGTQSTGHIDRDRTVPTPEGYGTSRPSLAGNTTANACPVAEEKPGIVASWWPAIGILAMALSSMLVGALITLWIVE